MPRKRAKKTVKKPAAAASEEEEATELPISLIHREVERQTAAIRVTRDVEIERLLTDLRLLKSCCTQEQLRASAGPLLRELFPNLSFEKGMFDMEWKETVEDMSIGEGAYEREILKRFSCAGYRDFSAIRTLGGLDLTNDAVRTTFLGGDGFQTRDLVFEGQSGAPVFGLQDGLQTPGFTSQKLSIGMTPKTLRVPKPGEMLLSVRGSPLGVYKEDNMEAIHESEEG